jgi:hypothetical protein
MALEGGNGSIMVGMFVCLCLASQNPFEWEFFVPARMDLGVKLLIQRKNHNYCIFIQTEEYTRCPGIVTTINSGA